MTPEIQLQRVSRDQPLPLSIEQYRLWFLQQLDPDSIHFNINWAYYVDGALDEERFEQSFNKVICRHESLRTVFRAKEHEPEQIVLGERRIQIQVADLQALPEDDREAQALALMDEAIKEPFSLEEGPLLRIHLYKLQVERYVLLLTVHHIVADFVSMGKLIEELAFYYNANSNQEAGELPPLPVQFADYAYWQKLKMETASFQNQLSYWKEKLSGELPVLRMPIDHARPPAATRNGARTRSVIPADLTEQLKSFSRKNGVTLFITLLAAYQTLLYRYSGQEDICIGTSVTSRSQPELRDLIGLFVNTLVLRTNLEGNPTFAEVLKRTRKTAFGALAHQDIPYEKLIEEMQAERQLSHNPFFQTMFTLLTAPEEDGSARTGPAFTPFEFKKKASALELNFTVTEQQGVLIATMDYNTDLYNTSTIERLLGHFRNLLAAAVLDAQRPISLLPMLEDAEHRLLLRELSGRRESRALPEACVHKLFAEQVRRTPDTVAVRFKDQQLTYRELDEYSNQVANYLSKNGCDANTPIGISMERSLELIAGLLGILKLGGAYVPVDPNYPRERRLHLLQDAQVRIVLASEATEAELRQDGFTAITLSREGVKLSQQSAELDLPPGYGCSPDDLMYIIYTSGSTGMPKGVMVAHRGVVNHCLHAIDRFQLGKGTRVLQFTSIGFDVSVQEIFPALLSGATLVLWKDKHAADSGDLFEWLGQERINVLNVTTAYWSQLVNDLKLGRSALPSDLRLVIVGGEKVSRETYVDWKQITAGKVRWINDYGLTETTITAAMFEPDASWMPDAAVPIGRPPSNMELYILDKYQQPVPVGVYGELYIGGVGVAIGYWNRPDLTRQRFVPNPLEGSGESRLYRTGDLARFLPDGNVEFIGRIDNQVKIRGYRIELAEIEAALAQYEKLAQAVVLPYATANGSTQLAAYIVLAEPAVQINELRGFLRSKLPDYMVPAYFVTLEQIPLTDNGKVNTAALPKPEIHASQASVRIAPRTSFERATASLWEELLAIPSVSITDNFFDIGGNSLFATQLVARAKQLYQCQVPLRLLFEYPVLADWSEQIEGVIRQQSVSGEDSRPESCIVKVNRNGGQLPIFFVHPVGGSIACYFPLARQLGDNQPFYALQAQGLVQERSELKSIEQMADHYVREILAIQPQGPFRLGGWSMGGFIAYEIAKRLKKAGHEVIQLAIIDSYINRLDEINEQVIWFNFIRQLAAAPGKTVSESMLLSWRDSGIDDSALCVELQALGLLPEGMETEELRRLIRVYTDTAFAFYQYRPEAHQPLQIDRVQLFRAEDSPEAEGWWSGLVSRLELHQVQADHFGIVHHSEVGQRIDLYAAGEALSTATDLYPLSGRNG